MEDASDSSRGVAPLINNVALPGSSPSLPVSVTGCKSHPVANKKVEARGEKLLPTALPPSEPKVAQKLPRSAERRGSASGTGSPVPSRPVAVPAAALAVAAGRDSGAGRVALAAFLVGRCGGGPALAGEGAHGPGSRGGRGTKRGGARGSVAA
ncbi:Gm20403 [Phodopus roborovskii]|uniref:Gm20403 protein n=1 Tax=Phodopus roborovskii TaxID=109678 RepID=A0AAU9ZRZ8_PHORO|nr:Gm20403 [Phodopus roborovskii]